MFNLVNGARVWELHATHGLPLDFSIPELAINNQIPTWSDLLTAAEMDGANIARLLEHLDAIIGDSYKPEEAKEIREKMKLLRTWYVPE